MATSDAQQRAEIRKMCENLRKLLASVQPEGVLAILQDVGAIESETLVATTDEMSATRASLHRLMRQLKDAGIIDAARWQEFFGRTD